MPRPRSALGERSPLDDYVLQWAPGPAVRERLSNAEWNSHRA